MDYKNGKIYTIRSHKTDMFYIGSTTQTLTKRFSYHNTGFIFCEKNEGKRYTSSHEIIKLGDAYIELLEEFPCENKQQLNKQEGQQIRFYKDKLVNCRIPGRTQTEHRVDNIDSYKEKDKLYYDKNKQQIAKKLSIKIKCECGSQHTINHKSHHLRSKKHIDFTNNNPILHS